MAVIFEDAYTVGADQALTARTPSPTGTGYTQIVLIGTSVMSALAATDDVQASASAASSGQTVKIAPAPSVAEYDIEYRLSALDTGAATRPIGPLARMSNDTPTNYYRSRHLPTGHASPDTELMLITNTTKTSLGTVDTGILTTDVFVLEIRDNSQRLLKNGTAILTASDTSITAAGGIGFNMGQIKGADSGNISTSWRFDDFKVTEFIPATAEPQIYHALYR